MTNTQLKVLVHFETNKVEIYTLKKKNLKLVHEYCNYIKQSDTLDILLNKIDEILFKLEDYIGVANIEVARLYASGFFQDLSLTKKEKLRMHVFVYHGLYFNLIEPDLQDFYLEKSLMKNKTKNLMTGLICQEFRKIVICGSFQQNLKEIGEIMSLMNSYNIQVLSPWTTKCVTETIGTDFVLLEGQELINKRDSWRHKCIHMNKFLQSDAIVVCNPDGYVGKGTMFEFGFIVAHSKRIIFMNEPKDITFPFPFEIGLNF